MNLETITALATPAGQSSIAVIRVSGEKAFEVCDSILIHEKSCAQHRGYTVHRASVAKGRRVIDDALVTVFHEPHSYTGQDTVEISVHGGSIPVRATLSALLGTGARLAEPGEFTMRAYLNGKLDLASAEAVCDLITSSTEEAHRAAISQRHGSVTTAVNKIRDLLLEVLAMIEASIDFPEDVGDLDTDRAVSNLDESSRAARSLLATADRGILQREGATVTLTGQPNVGKSSLMNALLKKDRAIVTAIPGTTRDVIEESVNIRGIPVRLQDTAGMRESADLVEQLGIERSRESARSADLVLLVRDATVIDSAGSSHLPDESYAERTLVIWNKIDSGPADFVRPVDEIRVSALTGAGLDELEEAIAQALVKGERPSEAVVISHARHKTALEGSVAAITRARECLLEHKPIDFAAIEVQSALTALGHITGQTAPQDVINEIFSRFCIGK